MARELIWRRASRTDIASGVGQTSGVVALRGLVAGETVTRVRFRYQFTTASTVDFGYAGSLVGVGILMAQRTPPPITVPITDPDADWMWWEHAYFRPGLVTFTSAGTEVFDFSFAPDDGGERDVKAMRVVPPTPLQSLFFCYQVHPDTTVQNQVNYAVGASIGILLP